MFCKRRESENINEKSSDFFSDFLIRENQKRSIKAELSIAKKLYGKIRDGKKYNVLRSEKKMRE